MVSSVTGSAAVLLGRLPAWATLVRAANPGPMTLEGTNSWVLRAPGARECVVVDPGPFDEDHLQAVAAHGPVGAILLTHAHPDHRDGLGRLTELTGAREVRLAAAPAAGAEPSAGPEPSAGIGSGGLTIAGLHIECLATPGHTSDSVTFVVSLTEETDKHDKTHEGRSTEGDGHGIRVVLTGDTILGRGTTVVAYPDGDLRDYLASLRRLERCGPLPVLPGHGPALADCAAAARFYLDHRLARLEQVRALRAALGHAAQEPDGLSAIVATVYADVDHALWPAAELSVRAQLAYLEQLATPDHPAAEEHTAYREQTS